MADHGVPLLVATPVVAILLGASERAVLPLLASLALGTPTLSLIGGIGAGLALGARRGGVLIPLLVLPLYLPVLIFGAAAVEAGMNGAGLYGPLAILGALLLAALPLAPLPLRRRSKMRCGEASLRLPDAASTARHTFLW